MSLKGYQWLVNNRVVMSYLFKDRILDIWEPVSEEALDRFKAYISPLKIADIIRH